MHDRLDAMAGPLAEIGSYKRYLTATFAFRAALEAKVLPGADCNWNIQCLVDALKDDLNDLGLAQPEAVHLAAPASPSALAGMLYVAEGSALGARLIQRRAAALGLGPDHGARHLATQTAERERWKSFLHWLESNCPDPEQAIHGGRAAFEVALSAYGIANGQGRVAA